MLLATEALVIVASTLEELLEVWLAIELPLQGCVRSQTEFGVAVLAAEARVVKDEVVGHQSLHWVNGLFT